jgi:hypothetical protein
MLSNGSAERFWLEGAKHEGIGPALADDQWSIRETVRRGA